MTVHSYEEADKLLMRFKSIKTMQPNHNLTLEPRMVI